MTESARRAETPLDLFPTIAPKRLHRVRLQNRLQNESMVKWREAVRPIFGFWSHGNFLPLTDPTPSLLYNSSNAVDQM